MNGRPTIILVLAALLLGGWLYVTERQAGRSVAVGDGSAHFRRIDPREVLSVEIIRTGTAIRIERTNSAWWLRAPVVYPAQSAALDGLLETLGTLVPRAHITAAELAAQPGALAAFGLENPETLTIRSRSGISILRLGGRTPLGNQVYFQQVGEDGVFTADAGILASLPTTPDAWRDRRLLAGEADGFDRIEVAGLTGFEAERGTNGVWTLLRPLAARANADQIHRLLMEVAGLSVSAFVTDSAAVAAEDYGLAKPPAQLVLKRGTNELVRLQVGGSPTNAPGEVFVRRSGPGNIVRVTNSIVGLLQQPLAAYRDRRLLPSVAGMTRLEIGTGTNRFTVDREGTNWFVSAPRRFPADSVWIRETLRRAVGLQIESFPNDLVTDAARYGLDQPVRTYAFSVAPTATAPGRPIATLEFGAPAADGRRVYVRRSDEPGVFEVPMADFALLPVSAGQFRDWAFDPTNAGRIEIRQQGRTRVLVRGAAGKWDGGIAIGGTLADPAIDEALYRIGHTATGRYPAPQEAALRQFAFEQVDHSVTVTLKQGGPFRTLQVRFGGRPNAVNQFVLARFDDEAEGVLTQFPLLLYQDFIGPWLGAPAEPGPGNKP